MHRWKTLGVAALAALLTSPAHGFAPHDHPVAFGIEGERVLTFHATTQSRLARQPAWRAFVDSEGAGWEARFDERLRTPLRMWGAPIDIGPTDTADQVVAGLLALADRHPALLGADASRLRLRSARYNAQLDTWYVDLDALVSGVPIADGGITARVRGGRLVMLGAETYPGLKLHAAPRLDRAAGTEAALRSGPAPHADHQDVTATLVAVPVEGPSGGVILRAAWRVESRTVDPVGRWEIYVDAQSGKVFGVRDHVRYTTGSLLVEHDLRTADGQTTISPLPHATLLADDGESKADAFGEFAFDGPVTARLRSPYFRVRNASGDDGELFVPDGNGLFDDEAATEAERTTYVFLHEIHEWAEHIAPGVMQGWMEAKVNLDDTCNAYFDGSVNFFRAGRGCNNTGRIADVIYHEWGHGFHYFSLESGRYDGSLGEGAADTIAFLQTNDPVIAPYFRTNGGGIRNVRNNRSYPEDYRANESYVHSNGLIFGGAMWDLFKALETKHGTAAAQQTVGEILAGMLKGGPTLVTAYEEAIFADDDDGDLSNGTPNRCDIVDAFGKHGLGPLGTGSAFVAFHEAVEFVEPDKRVRVSATLDATAPECFEMTPAHAAIHYRVDGGAWSEQPMMFFGDEARGTLPAFPEGATVEYWIDLRDLDGQVVTAPSGAAIAPYTFKVGAPVAIYCNDFEQDDGGFTSELVDGSFAEGADDWTWGRPRGLSGDPLEAASGNMVWGNDLGGGRWDGAYQASKHNRLTSPPLDTRGYDGVYLTYHRWLQVEDGAHDRARVLVNGERVWRNHASSSGEEHHLDTEWIKHVVELDGLADLGAATLAWEIQSNEAVNFGGWTFDDVCLLAPATPNNRLNINDLVLEGDGSSGVTLTFSAPRHVSAEEVVVVRKRGSLPTGRRQGQVVERIASPEPGAPLVVQVDNAEDPFFYAVFATDGRDWLSRAELGVNGAYGSAQGPLEPPVTKGCTTAPVSPAPAWLLIGLLALRRRR